MNTFDNVRKAFAPLGERLHFFEAGLHLINNNEFDIAVNQHDFYYNDMIDKVGRDVNLYDSAEVYELANEYADRAIKILLGFKKQKESSDEAKLNKWEDWDNELHEYLIHLYAIMDTREERFKKIQESSQHNIIQKVFELPENFEASDYTDDFTPKLSSKQAALFLLLLKNQGLIPMYTDTALAKLSTVFFARNAQNVRKNIINIHEIRKEAKELSKLKSFLLSMVEEIDNYSQK